MKAFLEAPPCAMAANSDITTSHPRTQRGQSGYQLFRSSRTLTKPCFVNSIQVNMPTPDVCPAPKFGLINYCSTGKEVVLSSLHRYALHEFRKGAPFGRKGRKKLCAPRTARPRCYCFTSYGLWMTSRLTWTCCGLGRQCIPGGRYCSSPICLGPTGRSHTG